jgi:Fe-S cluster biosynthesis and repair protein YggX
MADEKCSDTSPAVPSPQPAGQSGRMVKCIKFGREMPGLDRIPWKGELGKRIFENVSKEAWALWIEHSKMVMNEYRLNPVDAQSQKIMGEQMEQFFFGEGAKAAGGLRAAEGQRLIAPCPFPIGHFHVFFTSPN